MGRGAEAEINYNDEETAQIDGWCKWSVQSAMIDNAISMRTEPNLWAFSTRKEELPLIKKSISHFPSWLWRMYSECELSSVTERQML